MRWFELIRLSRLVTGHFSATESHFTQSVNDPRKRPEKGRYYTGMVDYHTTHPKLTSCKLSGMIMGINGGVFVLTSIWILAYFLIQTVAPAGDHYFSTRLHTIERKLFCPGFLEVIIQIFNTHELLDSEQILYGWMHCFATF